MNELDDLMQSIARFDCQPAVFRVLLRWDDRQSGYTVIIQFRSAGPMSDVSCHGDTAIEALKNALAYLKQYHSKCPACGQYLRGEGQTK